MVTERHPILNMLGLGSEWSAKIDASGCPYCGKNKGRIYVSKGRTWDAFTPDGFVSFHSRWVDTKSLKLSHEQLGIELVERIGHMPCTKGHHEYWTWKRKENDDRME